MGIQELLSRYNAGYDLLINQINQIPHQAINFKPNPDKWSINEIISHLADSEANGFVRARKITAKSGAKITVYEQNLRVEILFYKDMDYKDSLELIRFLRMNLYQVLKRIDADTWHNYIYHPESGKITLLDWIQLYIDHIDVHVQQMHRNYYDWRKINEKEIV